MSDALVEARTERTKWFLESRFGMFIHWGLYSIPAPDEDAWFRSAKRISLEDYQTYFDEFNPVDYDPKKWAKLAKEAGMQYVVLTTKHHDGFCLFDSKLTDYKAPNTKCGRDLVREYVDAFRAEGIKIGFYYSLLDWHHPDFPHFGERYHPTRDNPECSNENRDFNRYIEYFHGQVRELLTNYGKIDLLWFDFSYDDMIGEKWGGTRLMEMVRSLQPGIVVNNRLEAAGERYGSILTEHPKPYAGDFASPEQVIPPQGMTDINGKSIPWESCMTLNDHWGYCAHDHHYKTPRMIVHNLVECVSKNGNLILNVGPNARGEIPEESIAILKEVGHWMDDNHDSIYGCGISDMPKPDWGRYTRKGNKLYAHIYEDCTNAVQLDISPDRIEKIRLLSDRSEIVPEKPWNTAAFPDKTFFTFGGKSFPLPDPLDTVVEITLKD